MRLDTGLVGLTGPRLDPGLVGLGVVLGPSWGSLGARRPCWGRLGAILEPSEAILGRLGASDEGKMKHSILHVFF